MHLPPLRTQNLQGFVGGSIVHSDQLVIPVRLTADRPDGPRHRVGHVEARHDYAEEQRFSQFAMLADPIRERFFQRRLENGLRYGLPERSPARETWAPPRLTYQVGWVGGKYLVDSLVYTLGASAPESSSRLPR